MHGRKRVDATPEAIAAKAQEREQKVTAYLGIADKVEQLRAQKVYTLEAFKVAEKMVVVNPDHYTTWNYRREMLDVFKGAMDEVEYGSVLSKEFALVETCIASHPKTYWLWNHRRWLIEACPAHDLKFELGLCDKLLMADARNFHCWDYRRFVARKSGVSAEDELAFTTHKINENFSNYSAWHYRSSLLPVVHPGDNGLPSQQALLDDFNLVQNACFTEPNDQSAWFYQRWLIGNVHAGLRVTQLYISRRSHAAKIVLSFSEPVQADTPSAIAVAIDGVAAPVTPWRALAEDADGYSNNWTCDLHSPLIVMEAQMSLCVKVDTSLVACDSLRQKDAAVKLIEESVLFASGQREGSLWLCDRKAPIATVTKELLLKGLESCTQLLELEPDSKWTWITSVFLRQAIDARAHHDHVTAALDELTRIDPMRHGFYVDMKSRHVMRGLLRDSLAPRELGEDDGRLPEKRDVVATGKGLTSLGNMDGLVSAHTLDVSHNSLRSLEGVGAGLLLRKVIAEANAIEQIPPEFGGLTNLRTLNLKDNNIRTLKSASLLSISEVTAVKPLVEVQFLSLWLLGNPIARRYDYPNCVWKALPLLEKLDGHEKTHSAR